MVIDASVLVKWFLGEADSGLALRLRDRHVNGEIQLAAPSLIVYETLNALRYSGAFAADQLKDAAAAIQNYGLALYGPDGEIVRLAVEASEENDLTIYDGSYLGLAKKLGADFVTADRALVGRLAGDYAEIAKLLEAESSGRS